MRHSIHIRRCLRRELQRQDRQLYVSIFEESKGEENQEFHSSYSKGEGVEEDEEGEKSVCADE